jgi:hypothetical protein
MEGGDEMNIETGEIELLEDGLSKENMIPVDLKEATSQQLKKMRVSLHDHKSELGKQLTEVRSMAGSIKNQKRNIRKRLLRGER